MESIPYIEAKNFIGDNHSCLISQVSER